jgi:glycosyltransferase involved in cell wall biosynthesis
MHGDELLVIQIAENEGSRRGLGPSDLALHRYPYRLLFEGNFESSGTVRRCIRLCREIYSYRPGIVVLLGYSDISSWCALIISSLMGITRIIAFDSTAIDRPRVWYFELVKKIFVRSCNGAFAYGSKSKEYLMQLGMPPGNIFINCQAVHNEEIAAVHANAAPYRDKRVADLGAKQRNFIYVGRLSEEKNIRLLMSAFSKLKASDPAAAEWGLILVGDGPLRQTLEKDRISDIVFTGGKLWREVPEYFALADVFILPSSSEPWGLVVNEAMVCGLPVIVSDRCGAACDLVVSGENGFVFDPYNENELLDRMRYFIANHGSIRKMGECSEKIIAQYTPENAASRMYDGIQSVLKENVKNSGGELCA